MIKKVHKWREIAAHFTDNLIVGNGGSIAVCPDRFRYKDLHAYAVNNELLKSNVIDVFKKATPRNPDFEKVLYQLWLADFINKKFDVEKSERERVREGYTLVRRALINTVKDIHPKQAQIESKLQQIGRFICNFSNVLYLNYDLILYWASLKVNSKEKHRCKDGFSSKASNKRTSISRLKFSDDLEKIWEPYNGNSASTAIFYPHGSLMLYQTRAKHEERKLGLAGDDMLDIITEFWAKNDNQPLFVCEGSSDEKLASVSGSNYLTTVYQKVIPRLKNSFVIYGWSMGEEDEHIIRQLKRESISKVAVSIVRKDRSEQSISKEQGYITDKLSNLVSEENIYFFDADSKGCWCH